MRLPHSVEASPGDTPALNKPLQRVLSEYVRRTKISLSRFVGLVRGPTAEDCRPNKHMLPEVLSSACEGYQHRETLLDIARYGARVPLLAPLQRKSSYPANHKSTIDWYPVLVRNVRKEQNRWCCLVFDQDILEIWTEVHISPFGVVDKGDSDPLATGRTIHDLSFPVGLSINDHTDSASICAPTFEKCDAIATEILLQQNAHPSAEVKLQAGDVAPIFRNICTRSDCAYLFGGRIEPDNTLVIDLAAAFGWSGSPTMYGIVGGTIAFIHGLSSDPFQPRGLFSYYWVDDHINVAADVGSNSADADISLRNAMITVLGDGAINENKFTPWSTRQKGLGLIFDTVAQTVSMSQSNIDKAQACVAVAYAADSLSRSDYRSLLGRLRHVATCVRSTRPFLQRRRAQERHFHRWHRIPVVTEVKHDLVWWAHILRSRPAQWRSDGPLLGGSTA